MAQIWKGDFTFTRVFINKADAEKAIATVLKEAEAKGDYISDTAIVEMALDGTEFINTYSNQPEY